MVTAIVIPIICLYFYWVAKKEMRESLQKWQELNKIPEESVISGEIVQVSGHKERFSYYRHVYVMDLIIQTELKKQQLRKVIPIDREFEIPQIERGTSVIVYGNWDEDHFRVSRIEKRA